MTKLELIDVEGELGVVLPEQILSRLGATLGDELVLVETSPGYLLISATLAPESGTRPVAS
jgi:hypothetical protein